MRLQINFRDNVFPKVLIRFKLFVGNCLLNGRERAAPPGGIPLPNDLRPMKSVGQFRIGL